MLHLEYITDSLTEYCSGETPTAMLPTVPSRVETISNGSTSTPTSRGQFARFKPSSCLLNLSGEYESDDDFEFFRAKKHYNFETSSEASSTASENLLPDTRCVEPVTKMVYIDDYNSIEKLKVTEAQSHISVHRRKLKVLAQKSEKIFNNVQSVANDVGMKVNARKTQLLCIHASNNNEITSYIRNGGDEIVSTNTLKILGFNFSPEPSAVFHVTTVINKFYGKLWTLRFLKKSGMKQQDLLKIYESVLRPSEYSSIIYGPLIPEYISQKLESVQRQAHHIIFGYDVDCQRPVDEGTIETLSSRREAAMLKFALKASNSERFGKQWFRETPILDRAVRTTTRNKYIEPLCRTERGKNNPLVVMTRMLNEHHRAS